MWCLMVWKGELLFLLRTRELSLPRQDLGGEVISFRMMTQRRGVRKKEKGSKLVKGQLPEMAYNFRSVLINLNL